MEIITAAIGAISLVVVAIVERRGRKDNERWEVNTKEHNALVNRMEDIGSNLGRSLDRVEGNLGEHIVRLENKIEQHDEVLFSHLASHAEAAFAAEPVSNKRRRNK